MGCSAACEWLSAYLHGVMGVGGDRANIPRNVPTRELKPEEENHRWCTRFHPANYRSRVAELEQRKPARAERFIGKQHLGSINRGDEDPPSMQGWLQALKGPKQRRTRHVVLSQRVTSLCGLLLVPAKQSLRRPGWRKLE